MVSQIDGLELLKRIATPVRWTHFSPVSDGGSSIYRFKDARGQILVLFWDDGFSEANHIHLAVMDESFDNNPYEGPDSASFDGENNTDIATELHRLLQSAATEPMPTDDLNTFSDTDFQRFLKHLIQKVNLMGNPQPE